MKTALSARPSDPLGPASVKADTFGLKVWSLKHGANYGSKHYDEHPLEITGARLGADGRTVTLAIPALAPTQCYELKASWTAAGGTAVTRSLHGTIHQLAEP